MHAFLLGGPLHGARIPDDERTDFFVRYVPKPGGGSTVTCYRREIVNVCNMPCIVGVWETLSTRQGLALLDL